MRVLARLMTCGLLLCLPAGAIAAGSETDRKSVEVGIGLICNSEAQVQRFLTLHLKDESPEIAIRVVNTEVADPSACSMAAIAFTRGKEATAVPAPGGQMRIIEIKIVAAQTPFGWQPVTGLVQFTAIFEKLDEA